MAPPELPGFNSRIGLQHSGYVTSSYASVKSADYAYGPVFIRPVRAADSYGFLFVYLYLGGIGKLQRSNPAYMAEAPDIYYREVVQRVGARYLLSETCIPCLKFYLGLSVAPSTDMIISEQYLPEGINNKTGTLRSAAIDTRCPG